MARCSMPLYFTIHLSHFIELCDLKSEKFIHCPLFTLKLYIINCKDNTLYGVLDIKT
jgi:hypothetical protein